MCMSAGTSAGMAHEIAKQGIEQILDERREGLLTLYSAGLTSALTIVEQLQAAIDRLVELDATITSYLDGNQ